MTTQISVETISPITHNQIPVITTELLAQLYGTETNNIKVNYTRNAERFVCGKHYFKLEGAGLREFKNKVTQSNLVAPRTKHLILWTERGAARHAKMLETDQAWEVFEKLEDCYFSQGKTTQTEQQAAADSATIHSRGNHPPLLHAALDGKSPGHQQTPVPYNERAELLIHEQAV